MANEDKKNFNQMMNNNKDMPKVIHLDKEQSDKWNAKTMIIAPPLYYDKIMKQIPYGKLITGKEIRDLIAKENKVDMCDSMTAGIFINICAWASYQRVSDKTPYHRVLKTNGELNPKYPGGIEEHKKLLESEGHTIIKKGSKNIKYFVKDYESKLYELN